MKSQQTNVFYDCETKAGVRGSASLMLFENSYACFFYPHNQNTRIPIAIDDLVCYDENDTFNSLQIHLKYRIYS